MKKHNFIMLDLQGKVLTDQEKTLLQYKAVAGVILFSRNFENAHQIKALIGAIKSIKPDILIAVDQEGGRVQRFVENGFTKLPKFSFWQDLYNKDKQLAFDMIQECGWVTGYELGSVGVDINFSPVLDLDRNFNAMLKTRCLSHSPHVVTELAKSYIKGVQSVGVQPVIKHFPGHGGVKGDTHTSVATDQRTRKELKDDLYPFVQLIDKNMACVMCSHVIYSKLCKEPPIFSDYWLRSVLREELKFNGVIFSDCLNMSGASTGGSIYQRVKKSCLAGCDIAVICNAQHKAIEVLENYEQLEADSECLARIERLINKRYDLPNNDDRVKQFKNRLNTVTKTVI